ncbi:MAG TPA: ATP-binding protein [Mucilaginibacter sp.]|nr:ATP-binding protein [Mucilaginibacter sp.]
MTIIAEQTDSTLQFLAGGGENGALIRSFDWSKTALGDPAYWPKSLKTCVRIILTSRQPMFVWWGKELINIYNDAYQTIVGGRHPQALGQPAIEVWKEIWHEIQPRVDQSLNKNEGTYDEALLLIMERNGYPEETYYTFSYSPVPGDDSNPEGIICANTDDTDRIIGERQLRTLKDLGKAYINCKSNKDIFDSTINALKENTADFPFAMIYQADEDNEVFTLAGLTEIVDTGIAPISFEKGKNRPWFQKNGASGHYHVELLKQIPANLPKGCWPISPFQAIAMPITKSGQNNLYGWLVVGLNPYRLLDEKYTSFFQLVTDQIASGIGNIRVYEEEQKRLLSLMEIDKAKTVFFNNVSHEFRTPLTLMLGPLEEMLHNADSLPKHIHDNIASTYRNSQRLLKLVNSLLEFSRIEAGRVQACYQPVDLCALTTDLASGFRSIIEKAGLKYHVECRDFNSTVYVDKEMWEKIVLNLLSNAFKYTLKGQISVSLSHEGKNAVLQVKDSGVGIPKSELPRMFERFHRVPNVVGRTHEGTGIGLSLIHELVKMHHGEISVESKEGAGSTFTVRIPVGKEHLPHSQVIEIAETVTISSLKDVFIEEASSLLSTDAKSNGQGHHANTATYADAILDHSVHILVVDDNADMRAYLQRIIEPYFFVTMASNGKEALERIQESIPTLIVSDFMMPVMNGKELLKTIRNTPSISRLPFILLSARAGEEARIDGLEAGADDYLVKPFSGKELITRIRSHVTIAKARNHAEELLKQLFINAPMAISILRGPQFVVELANPEILAIWGKKAEDVYYKPIMTAIPELSGQGFEDLMLHVLTTGKRFTSGEYPVSLLRSGQVRKIYVKFIYEPLREDNNNVTGVIVLAHEITDLVNARILAQRNSHELAEQIKRKDEFMSVASHELKTPLTTMKAALQILGKLEIGNPKAELFVSKANKQMDRLTSLVTDLLSVTSLQSGKMKFYFEDFSLDEMLGDVIEQHQQSQSGHRIVLEGKTGIILNADNNRIEQVVNNFLSNAIKYSPGADKIIVKVERKKNTIKLSVKDFGIGIPEDQISHVFDRFYRVEESGRNFQGLGLGLYISAEIIRRHNGKIGVERNEGEGSTFWFTLPLTK